MSNTPPDAANARDEGEHVAPDESEALERPEGNAEAGSTTSGEHAAPRCPHCGEPHPSTYSHCPRTGKPLQVGPALVGRVIAGRYRVTGILGEGGMGAVYIAEHLLLGRKVAIKRLHPELAGDEKAVARFQREARAAASTGHEHIVDIMDLGYAEDGAPYLVMEYLRGVSLAQTLKREARLPVARTLRIVIQVLQALAAVHERGIVHRDLKPDNIFLTRRGNLADYVKVLDFGISKMKQEDGEPSALTRTGVTMGTPYYMSPEQARGMRKLDHRVDLYAVAVIAYECMTGRLPLMGDNYHALLQQILGVEPLPLSSYLPGVDPTLDALITRGLAKKPDDRFASATEMCEALTPFANPSSARNLAVTRQVPPGAEALEAMRVDARAPTEALSPSDEARAPGPSHAAPAHAISALGTPAYGAPARTSTPWSSSASDVKPARGSRPSWREEIEALPSPRAPSQRFDVHEPSASLSATPSGSIPSTPVPMEGAPRYFFAASDDWDGEVRRRRSASGATSAPATTSSASIGSSGVLSRIAEPVGTSPRGRTSGSYADATPSTTSPLGTASGAVAPSLVRGTIINALLSHLGRESAARVKASLPEALRERLTSVILPMEWLPIELFDGLLSATGPDAHAHAIRAGRVAAEHELSTTHPRLLHGAHPTAMIERVPYLTRVYFSAMEARTSATTSGVRIVVEDRAPESVYVVGWYAGFWQRCFEMVGAAEPRIVSTTSRQRGDAESGVVLRWR